MLVNRFVIILSLFLMTALSNSALANDLLTGVWKGTVLEKPVELALWPDRRNHRSTWKEWTAYLYLPSYDCFLIGNVSTKGTQSQINMSAIEIKGRKNNCRKNTKYAARFRMHGEIDLQPLPQKIIGELSFLFLDKNRIEKNKPIFKMILSRQAISPKMKNFVKRHQHRYFLKPLAADYAKFATSNIKVANKRTPSSVNTLVAAKKDKVVKSKIDLTKLKQILWQGKIFSVVSANDISSVKKILKGGGNVNEQNDKGQTALIIAASLQYKKMLETLIAANANVNLVDHSNGSALAYATSTGNVGIVKLLMDANADVTLAFDKSFTPLMIAATTKKISAEHHALVQQLLRSRKGINKRNKQGLTALMLASASGKADMVKQLLAANANANLKSNGFTAVQMAKVYKKNNVVNVFKSYRHSFAAKADEQFKNGLDYMNQRGRKDYRKAAYWFSKAAKQGHARAEGLLGILYSLGRGVPKDYRLANYWLKKAADKNDADAQYNYGQMFQFGMGVRKNDTKAKYWYKKSALQEQASAQNNLASFYELGRGGKIDLPRAYFWYFRASINGVRGAKRDQTNIAKRMTLKQVKEATRLIKENTRRNNSLLKK